MKVEQYTIEDINKIIKFFKKELNDKDNMKVIVWK